MTLTAERVRELLDYDPETGVFKRRRWSGTVAAGCFDKRTGYVRIRVDGKLYQAHRLAWLYTYGELPSLQVDHINRDRADNRICNLRVANHAENQRNGGRYKNNSSGFKGVSWASKRGKWVAQIAVNGSSKNLGYFDCPKEAHAAYVTAAGKYHGEFANGG